MKVMLDTNIIISAAMFPHGRTAAAYMWCLRSPMSLTHMFYPHAIIEIISNRFVVKIWSLIKDRTHLV